MVKVIIVLLILLLSFSSYASLRGCSIALDDILVKNYSNPRDVFYVSIQYNDGSILGYDPTKSKFVGYKEVETRKATPPVKKYEDHEWILYAWPLFESYKDEYIYTNSNGLRIIKYPPSVSYDYDKNGNSIEVGKYITAYYIECAEGKNTIKIMANEPAILGWDVTVLYEGWEEIVTNYFAGLVIPEGLYGSFVITPKMGQRELILYVDKDYTKIKIELKTNPETMMDALKGCWELGLIKNKGILNSLLSKLRNADRQYKIGNVDTAKNIIRAFSNELSALEGKQIDKECVSALQMDIKAILGVNIVQEGLEKFIKESGSSGDILQLQSVKSEGEQAQGKSPSSSKKGLGCSMGRTSSAIYVLGWLLLPVFVFVKRLRRL
ncbi:MAG: hypothetical protein ACO2PP_11160 [Thermocrinis sp.]|uniref:hypothetical protein n=1 Tax=Thermocrinis sp. TaxID=2024383 RepID=UPI003BFB21E7